MSTQEAPKWARPFIERATNQIVFHGKHGNDAAIIDTLLERLVADVLSINPVGGGRDRFSAPWDDSEPASPTQEGGVPRELLQDCLHALKYHSRPTKFVEELLAKIDRFLAATPAAPGEDTRRLREDMQRIFELTKRPTSHMNSIQDIARAALAAAGGGQP